MMRPLIILVVMLTFGVVAWQVDGAQVENQAGLVVRFDDGRVETRCVSFIEEQITGYELLQRSGMGLNSEEAGAGVTICNIDGVGCPASNCFCQCQGDPCQYWSYWHWQAGQWRYSAAGASVYEVGHGDIDGWSWGPGSVSEATAPPAVSLEEICSAEDGLAASTAVIRAGDVESKPAVPMSTPAAAAGDEENSPSGSALWSYAIFGALVLILLGVIGLSRRRAG